MHLEEDTRQWQPIARNTLSSSNQVLEVRARMLRELSPLSPVPNLCVARKMVRWPRCFGSGGLAVWLPRYICVAIPVLQQNGSGGLAPTLSLLVRRDQCLRQRCSGGQNDERPQKDRRQIGAGTSLYTQDVWQFGSPPHAAVNPRRAELVCQVCQPFIRASSYEPNTGYPRVRTCALVVHSSGASAATQ